MAAEERNDNAPGACLRCKGEMLEGWIAERGSRLERQQWIPGQFTRSFWTLDGLKTAPGSRRLPVKTYRCVRCGYLESYANPETAE